METPSALANFPMVASVVFFLPLSRVLIYPLSTPNCSPKSVCDMFLANLSRFKFSPNCFEILSTR